MNYSHFCAACLLPCNCFYNRMHSYAKRACSPGPRIPFLLETRILKINICGSCEKKGKAEELQGKGGREGEAVGAAGARGSRQGGIDSLAHWLGMATAQLRISSWFEVLSAPLYWQAYRFWREGSDILLYYMTA